MKGSIKINYEWWKLGCSPRTKINPSHKGCLEEHAEEHIHECMGNGLTSGILLCDVNGESYRGHWELVK